ncbi:hypothetical protein [Streptomyces sp. NRRL B-1347]|nr:hypothetical protein [Streptomyces sp. NRRL B-1347]
MMKPHVMKPDVMKPDVMKPDVMKSHAINPATSAIIPGILVAHG